ncbi:MAG: class I SAM-dependent methyltransferase [Clostridia bacterium]|nr:class I SAM-dependent methyltransferase [Clostridia bacterium]
MKADYKNWMPKGMIYSFLGGAIGCGAVAIVLNALLNGTLKTVLTVVFAAAAVVLCGLTVWAVLMHRAFSYDGKRQMSRQIIEGTAAHVKLPRGGKCLDVGCGSGALAIAVAKRNPQAQVVGIDRWGKEYASFNKNLCESNARAEGVKNISFRQGDATHLDFADETFDAVVSNYVYHNIPGKAASLAEQSYSSTKSWNDTARIIDSGHVTARQKYLLETLRTLKKGGTFALHDIFSRSKYGDMQAFVKLLKDMGYQKVELIDTTDGRYMSKFEATWMALSGSALLTGIK